MNEESLYLVENQVIDIDGMEFVVKKEFKNGMISSCRGCSLYKTLHVEKGCSAISYKCASSFVGANDGYIFIKNTPEDFLAYLEIKFKEENDE